MNHFGEDFEYRTGTAAQDEALEEYDLYEALEISPSAQPDTLHRVYRILASRYHPDNVDTGDEEMFKKVLRAYRVISDPVKRAAYDVEWKASRRLQWKIFDQADATTKVAVERRKRRGILQLLYTKRVNAPREPTMTIHDLEELLGCPREHLEVSLWYLQRMGWVERSDNGRYEITVQGFNESEDMGTWSVPKDRMLPAARKSSAKDIQ